MFPNRRAPLGMLSREFLSHVKSVTGIDISHGSVDVYNRKAAEAGVADRMNAVVLDLQGTPGELDDKKFDVAIVGLFTSQNGSL